MADEQHPCSTFQLLVFHVLNCYPGVEDTFAATMASELEMLESMLHEVKELQNRCVCGACATSHPAQA